MAQGSIQKAKIRLQVLCEATRRVVFPTGSAMFVEEYEDVLFRLRQDGVDVDGFEILQSAVADPGEGRTCRREFFVMRLSGLLLHLAQVAPGHDPDFDMSERIFRALEPTDDEPPF